ncbi:TPA: hypothetical protein ACIVST_001053 [Salmonella enterica subsp. enterica serovar Aberdeen]
MKNKEQYYDVAGYTVASKLLNLLVDKGIITTSEGTAIYNAATELLKSAPAMKATTKPDLQLDKIISERACLPFCVNASLSSDRPGGCRTR